MYEELVKELRSKAEFLNVSGARENSHGPNLKNSFAEAMLKAADAIEELSKPRWIPVTDEPPLKVGDEGYNGYLVYSCGYYGVADYHGIDRWYDNKSYFYVDGEYDPDVTHFMPLPEPPEED